MGGCSGFLHTPIKADLWITSFLLLCLLQSIDQDSSSSPLGVSLYLFFFCPLKSSTFINLKESFMFLKCQFTDFWVPHEKRFTLRQLIALHKMINEDINSPRGCRSIQTSQVRVYVNFLLLKLDFAECWARGQRACWGEGAAHCS